MQRTKNYSKMICWLLGVIILIGCSPGASTVVNIRRDHYKPDMGQVLHELYKERKIFLHSVIDESKDTTNFYSYNPDRSVAFCYFYEGNSWNQPLASFYWYAYQKALESMDMIVEERKPSKDSPELTITFKSINSQQLHFHVLLISKTTPQKTLSKDYTISMPLQNTINPESMEKSAYAMIDKTVIMILGDPEFQKTFFNKVDDRQTATIIGRQKP
ncbi:MAG: hypothetical protein AB2L22_00915 [Syntrophales bacterium]